MFNLKATIRKQIGGDLDKTREQGSLPAVLYGEGIKENLNLEVKDKDLEAALADAGESSLLELETDGKKYEVLIHQVAKDPVTDKFLHIDFYKPSTTKKIEAEVVLVFIGEEDASAIKNLGGVLNKEFQSVHVKGLAHNLPKEIDVDVSELNTFEDRILIKDLKLPEGVEILREADEIVAHITEPTQEVEEEPKPAEGEEGGEGTDSEEGGEKEDGEEGAGVKKEEKKEKKS